MASVYLARRDGDDRSYAIKILHPHLAEQREYVDMLMDEARIATRLEHPNVVRTVEIGHDDDLYYLVMEYEEGVALDRLLRRWPSRRRPELIVPLAIDALHGLHAAHQLTDELGRSLELVHRDVTPGNLLVGLDGIARLTDFGVARARARITKTNPGVVKGKAGYVAPEVILGRDVDGRADVFSMGVLLWNALTGETLFDREDLASSLTSLLRDEIPPPSDVGLQPSPLFDAPILTALARDPEHRHASALEMAEALADALLMFPTPADRGDVSAWVNGTLGDTLARRREHLRRDSRDGWDPDAVEPLSSSAVVRKDPTGRVVSAIPGEAANDPHGPPAPEAGANRWPKILLGVVLAVLALGAAGALGAWIATRHATPPPATPTAPAADAPAPAPAPVELTPQMFGAPDDG